MTLDAKTVARLAAEATQGEWHWETHTGDEGGTFESLVARDGHDVINGESPFPSDEDAAFIAALPQIAELVAEQAANLEARDEVIRRYAREAGELEARIVKLTEAAKLARLALDGLMGDSDIEGDDSAEMKAMLALNSALAIPEKEKL